MDISMKREFQQINDPYHDCECLELVAYEALAQRSAVLRKIRASIGQDLEFGLHLSSDCDLVELHKALLQQTKRCVEVIRNLEAAEHKVRRHPSSAVFE